jgi:hypothetical protein
MAIEKNISMTFTTNENTEQTWWFTKENNQRCNELSLILPINGCKIKMVHNVDVVLLSSNILGL